MNPGAGGGGGKAFEFLTPAGAGQSQLNSRHSAGSPLVIVRAVNTVPASAAHSGLSASIISNFHKHFQHKSSGVLHDSMTNSPVRIRACSFRGRNVCWEDLCHLSITHKDADMLKKRETRFHNSGVTATIFLL